MGTKRRHAQTVIRQRVLVGGDLRFADVSTKRAWQAMPGECCFGVLTAGVVKAEAVDDGAVRLESKSAGEGCLAGHAQ